MRLEKIILNGFKSFADKTEIKFEKNFNAIVGPNGSGKSNIIDAIKWTLGQQKSKELRTQENTDIIFSGTINKKPKNVAEVTLIFDNQDKYLNIDYTEVSIKRRLYRNGENEYFLNNNKCRLKDINNLIMDKGFGKESFSIISQGKIEEIITSKSEKRRELIDEVAGINKYRSKKKIANQKLEKITTNAEKLTFIVEELEKQIKPLKIEAQKAEEYKTLKEEVAKKEKNLLANKILKYKEEENELANKINKIKISMNNLEKINTDLEKIKNKNELEINQKQRKIEENSILKNELENEEIKLANKLNLMQEKIKLYKNIEETELIEKIENKNNYQENKKKELQEQLSSIKPLVTEQQKQLTQEKEEIQRLKIKLVEYKQKEDDLTSKYNQNNYPYSVKKILQLNHKKVIGTLDSLIEPKIKYENAIKLILGNRKNEIVTENNEVVVELINYLKKEKIGRVTFSPLNTVKSKSIDEKTLNKLQENQDLYLCYASEAVVFDTKYNKVINSILGNIIISQNIEKAKKLANVIHHKYQIVTLDGEVFLPSGKILGGYTNNKTTIVNKQMLETISLEIKELQRELQQKEQTIDLNILQYNETKLKYDLLNKELENTQKSLKESREELARYLNTDNKQIFKNVDDYQIKKDQINAQKQKLIEEIKNQQVIIKNHILEKEGINQKIIDNNGEYKLENKKLTELEIQKNQKIMQTKNILEILVEKYSVSFTKIQEESTKINDFSKKEEELKEIKNKIKNLGFINLKAIEEYKEKKIDYEFYSENLQDLKQSKEKIEEIIKKLDKFIIIQFKESFEKLNNEFRIVFNHMFEGGSANLVLTNPNDILNTGIDIVAQPPGKKLQRIKLLSGGEKAMTAISLLFAILKIRIVPFVILDEVEAALDEANVARYAKYIKIFSQKTQFLIITHRQTTMNEVDLIYGVTMLEKGISSIVDIKFNE